MNCRFCGEELMITIAGYIHVNGPSNHHPSPDNIPLKVTQIWIPRRTYPTPPKSYGICHIDTHRRGPDTNKYDVYNNRP